LCNITSLTSPLSLFKDYDQYYASLAASAAPSTQHTPPPGEFSVLGDFEEDRKPNIEYLDSLNEYNKRSRSVEDQGESERKQARVGDGWGQQGAQENGELPMNGAESLVVDAEDVSAEDPIVYGLFFLYSPFYAMLTFSFSGWQTNAILPGW
jgi:transcription initiation factor TFIIE subunit alpha